MSFYFKLLILSFCIIASSVLKASIPNKKKVSARQIESVILEVDRLTNSSRDSAISLMETAFSMLKHLSESEEKKRLQAWLFVKKADFIKLEKPDSARNYLNHGHLYFIKHPDYSTLTDIYGIKADLDWLSGNTRECIANLDSAIYFAQLQSEPRAIAMEYFSSGYYLQNLDRWYESFDKATSANEYAILSGDSLALSASNLLLGSVYEHFDQLDKAEFHLAKSLVYGKSEWDLSPMYERYGDILIKNKKFEKVIESYNNSLILYKLKEEFDYALKIYVKIGLAYLEMGQYENAKRNYAEMQSVVDKLTIEGARFMYLFYSAKFHVAIGKKREAIEYLNKLRLLDYFEKSRMTFKLLKYLKDISILYDQVGMRDQSYLYLSKWAELEDSLTSHSNLKHLNDVEQLYLAERQKNKEINATNKALIASQNKQYVLGISLLIIILIATVIIYLVRVRAFKEKEQYKTKLQETLLEQVLIGQDEERQRLARELHDGIGQSLAALKMQLKMSKEAQASEKNLKRVETLCKEVRHISHQMMPVVLQENGLIEAVNKLVNSSLRKNGVEVDLLIHGISERLPSNIEIHLYRILQELINNILKHSKATKVGVQILKQNNKLLFITEDNGRGFSKNSSSNGIGLANIKSRLQLISGELEIESEPGNGTFIRIVLELKTRNKMIA